MQEELNSWARAADIYFAIAGLAGGTYHISKNGVSNAVHETSSAGMLTLRTLHAVHQACWEPAATAKTKRAILVASLGGTPGRGALIHPKSRQESVRIHVFMLIFSYDRSVGASLLSVS